MEVVFEWSRVLMNELPYNFLLEVVFRATVMFILLLIILRFAGKRGIKQLSVFEMVIIIALGSAVGDPMLYDDVGLLPGIVVVVVVIGLYRLITLLVARFKPLAQFLEGEPKCIIQNGEFILDSLNKENLAQDEFFSELRLKSVEHLGQIKYAYLETCGDISVFFKTDDEVGYGLPVLPNVINEINSNDLKASHYSCTFCAHTTHINENATTCKRCGKGEWVKSINTLRIS